MGNSGTKTLDGDKSIKSEVIKQALASLLSDRFYAYYSYSGMSS